MLKLLENKFILSDIIDNIVHCNFSWYKYENYATDLNNSNFENHFNIATAITHIEKNHINSDCIFSNIND